MEMEGEEENGPCNACYADGQKCAGSGMLLCGCPDQECRYLWCGRTTGLHALHRMHVTGDFGELAGPEEETGKLSRDIFLYGGEAETPEEWRPVLAKEREWMETRTEEVLAYLAEREKAGQEKAGLLESIGWLRKSGRGDRRRAITWLISAGAIPAPRLPQERPVPGQLKMFDCERKVQQWVP